MREEALVPTGEIGVQVTAVRLRETDKVIVAIVGMTLDVVLSVMELQLVRR